MNRAMAAELLCKARLLNHHPLRVISGNKYLFHHGDSFCISRVSTVVGISALTQPVSYFLKDNHSLRVIWF